MPRAVAISPTGLSSFFEICDTGPDGRPLEDPLLVGARGGGFTLDLYVRTEVVVSEARGQADVRITINGREQKAKTTRRVVEELLPLADAPYSVEVRHEIPVPIAAGFGTSGAGALSTALALSAALSLKLTYNQLGEVAHAAEVLCRTGLGTVGPLMLGGCILTLEPGGPGRALIDRLPTPRDLKVISGVFSPIETRSVLVRRLGKERINSAGRRALEAILADPCLETFMDACRSFALESGLATERTVALMDALVEADVPCAQNMIGEAVHAIAREGEELERALAVFKRFLPEDKIYVGGVCWRPAELVEVRR